MDNESLVIRDYVEGRISYAEMNRRLGVLNEC